MATSKTLFEKVNSLYVEIGIRGCDPTEITAEYNDLMEKYDFSNEVFTGDDNKKGIRFCDGETFVPAKYDEVKVFSSCGVPLKGNYAIVSRDGKDYLVNCSGEEVFEADELKPNIASITPVIFRKGDKWGIAYSNGVEMIEAKYDSIKPDVNGFIFLTLNGKEGFIANGNIVEPKFDSISIDAQDNIVVVYKGEEGYVDEYDQFSPYKNDAYYNMNMFL